MKIGFTGTQAGMTSEQKMKFTRVLDKLIHNAPIDTLYHELEFHHGDCIGADAEAGEIADNRDFFIAVHPPTNKSKRAFVDFDMEFAARPYLDRDHDIVDATDILIATPKEADEQVRSGTWATVRYALKSRPRIKPVIIILPDGTVVEYSGVKLER